MSDNEILLKTLEKRTGLSVQVLQTVLEQTRLLGYELKPIRTTADVQLPVLPKLKDLSLGEK